MQILDRDILYRALLLGLLISLIGISARPHQIDQAFLHTKQSLEIGRSDQAALYLRKIAEYFTWWPNLWLYAGRYAVQGSEPESAIDYFKHYGSLNDLTIKDQILLGDAYLQSGDLFAAERILKNIADNHVSTEEIYRRLAEIHRRQDNILALTEDLKSLFSIRPNNANLAYELGLLLSTQEPELALTYLEQAAQLDPSFSESAYKLQREIITARLAEEPAYTFLTAGRRLASMNEWKLASQAFHQAARTRPDYAEAWAFLGEAKQHLEDMGSELNSYPPGLSELETALQINPNSITANILMGIYWQRQNQYDQALNYVQIASDLDPSNPMLYAELAAVMAKTGDLEHAQEQYERAIELLPGDPTYWRLLAEFSLHYQLQVRQIALPAARRAVILSSDDPLPLDVLGQVLVILGDNLNAERYLRRALEVDKEYAPAHLHLGIVYMNRGENDRARAHFDLAKHVASNSWTYEQAQRLISYYFP